MTTIEQVRAASSAASQTREPVLRGAYLATARALLNELRAEVEHAEAMLIAGEEELRRCHLQRLAALRNEVARRAKAKAKP